MSEYGTPSIAWTQFVDLNPNHDGIASAEEFSTAIEVDFPRVKPTGIFSEEAFGTGFIYLQQQFVQPESLPEWLIQAGHRVRDAGLTYLDNLPDAGSLVLAFTTPYTAPPASYVVLEFNPSGTPTIRPQGISPLNYFGVASVDMIPALLPSGMFSETFGTAEIANLNRYLTVPGISSDEGFGTPVVVDQRQYVAAVGVSDSALGAPHLENLNRTIFPQRIDQTLAFGAAEVIGPQYISGAAITYDGAIGDHDVIGPRIVYPSGAASVSEFGTDFIAFSTRDVRPSSIQKPSNQVPAVLIGNAARDMDIYGIGNEDVGMGGPIIGEPPFDVIWGAGVGDACEFGETDFDMTGPTRRIRPGWPINNPSIRTEFGTAKIIPHTIHPTNVNTPAYGRPTVSNWIRYIDLSIGEKGIAGSRYGTLWISNWIRYIEPAGFDHSEVWWPFGPLPAGELNAVRHVSDGKLYPGSINDGAIGEPSVRINLC